MKVILASISLLFLISCSTQKQYTMIKNSSVFAEVNELGTSKEAFVSKYGKAINRDFYKEGTNTIENLYYVEKINGVIVTTKIKFINEKVVEQSNYKMEYSAENKIKELEDDIRREKLSNFVDGMNK